MSLRKSLFGISGLVLACGIVAFAQEPQPQAPSTQDDSFRHQKTDRLERRRERLGGREGMRHEGRRGDGIGQLTRELNLTEEQQQQHRSIMQRRLESTKTQREELFKLREKRMAGTFTEEDGARAKALHQEIRTAMNGVSTELAGVLTADQKAKLVQLKQERREKMEQRKKDRQERLQ